MIVIEVEGFRTFSSNYIRLKVHLVKGRFIRMDFWSKIFRTFQQTTFGPTKIWSKAYFEITLTMIIFDKIDI